MLAVGDGRAASPARSGLAARSRMQSPRTSRAAVRVERRRLGTVVVGEVEHRHQQPPHTERGPALSRRQRGHTRRSAREALLRVEGEGGAVGGGRRLRLVGGDVLLARPKVRLSASVSKARSCASASCSASSPLGSGGADARARSAKRDEPASASCRSTLSASCTFHGSVAAHDGGSPGRPESPSPALSRHADTGTSNQHVAGGNVALRATHAVVLAAATPPPRRAALQEPPRAQLVPSDEQARERCGARLRRLLDRRGATARRTPGARRGEKITSAAASSAGDGSGSETVASVAASRRNHWRGAASTTAAASPRSRRMVSQMAATAAAARAVADGRRALELRSRRQVNFT